MPKTKRQKELVLEQTKQNIEKSKSVVFAGYKGMAVKDLQVLRKELKEKGGKLEVVKINLADIAFGKDKRFEEIVGKAALALGYSFDDEIGTPKTIKKFAKNNDKLEILGGFYEGEFLNKEAMEKLADTPSKDELIVKLIMIVKSPSYGLVGALSNFAPRLVRVLRAIEEK